MTVSWEAEPRFFVSLAHAVADRSDLSFGQATRAVEAARARELPTAGREREAFFRLVFSGDIADQFDAALLLDAVVRLATTSSDLGRRMALIAWGLLLEQTTNSEFRRTTAVLLGARDEDRRLAESLRRAAYADLGDMRLEPSHVSTEAPLATPLEPAPLRMLALTLEDVHEMAILQGEASDREVLDALHRRPARPPWSTWADDGPLDLRFVGLRHAQTWHSLADLLASESGQAGSA